MVSQNPRYDIETALRLLRYKPHLLLGEVTFEHTIVWLGGFAADCSAYGTDWPDGPDGPFAKVLNKRGWKESARGEIHQMREKGCSDERIINELMGIHIAAYQRLSEDGKTAAPDDGGQERSRNRG